MTSIDLRNDTDAPEQTVTTGDKVLFLRGTDGAEAIYKGGLPAAALNAVAADGTVSMTGHLTLSADPTQNLHAATKSYVDASIPSLTGYAALTGATFTGNVIVPEPTASTHAATKNYVDTALSTSNPDAATLDGKDSTAFAQLATSNTFAGDVFVNTPTANQNPATKAYVDTAIAGINLSSISNADTLDGLDSTAFLQTSGGTITGNLSLNVEPTITTHVATKNYVDTAVSAVSASTNATTLNSQPASYYGTAADVTTAQSTATAASTAASTNATAITSLQTTQTSHSSSIATNTSSISTNTGNIATNTAAITALDSAAAKLAGATFTGAVVLAADPTVALGAATKSYVDAATAGVMTYKGAHDASTTALDGANAGAVVLGDTYTITVAGTVNGTAVEVGDVIVAEQDAPTTAAHWTYIQRNLADDGAFLPLAGGTLTGSLALAADPTTSTQAATKNYVDTQIAASATSGAATGITVTPTGNIASTDVQAALAELDTEKAGLAGAAFTGAVTLAADPTVALGAATKNYVDTTVSAVNASTLTSTATGNVSATTVQAAIAELDTEKMPIAGGAFTGAVTLAADPTVALGAATKNYVDTAVAGAGGTTVASGITVTPTGNIAATDAQAALAELDTEKAALAGATFTGSVLLAADPTVALGAATKNYVDTTAITAIQSGNGLSGDGTTGSNLVLVADPDGDNMLTNSTTGLLSKLYPAFPLQGAGNSTTNLSLALSNATGQRITTDSNGLFAPSETHEINWAVEALAGTSTDAPSWYARVNSTIDTLRFMMPSAPIGGETQVNQGTAVIELRVDGTAVATNTWDFAADGNYKTVALGQAITAGQEVVMVITSFAGLQAGENWMSPVFGFTYTESL